jgi:copper chaperone
MKHLFKVPDMSCGHCKMHIEKALQAWGKADGWTVDLAAKTVAVESAESREIVARIIVDVGYTPNLA